MRGQGVPLANIKSGRSGYLRRQTLSANAGGGVHAFAPPGHAVGTSRVFGSVAVGALASPGSADGSTVATGATGGDGVGGCGAAASAGAAGRDPQAHVKTNPPNRETHLGRS